VAASAVETSARSALTRRGEERVECSEGEREEGEGSEDQEESSQAGRTTSLGSESRCRGAAAPSFSAPYT
jgi:hypothetical protein